MKCDNCKHWKHEPEDWAASTIGYGRCLAVRERWEIQDEASTERWDDGFGAGEFGKMRSEALKRSKAYVQDGSEYKAELYTAPDFFCALFAKATGETER